MEFAAEWLALVSPKSEPSFRKTPTIYSSLRISTVLTVDIVVVWLNMEYPTADGTTLHESSCELYSVILFVLQMVSSLALALVTV